MVEKTWQCRHTFEGKFVRFGVAGLVDSENVVTSQYDKRARVRDSHHPVNRELVNLHQSVSVYHPSMAIQKHYQ